MLSRGPATGSQVLLVGWAWLVLLTAAEGEAAAAGRCATPALTRADPVTACSTRAATTATMVDAAADTAAGAVLLKLFARVCKAVSRHYMHMHTGAAPDVAGVQCI